MKINTDVLALLSTGRCMGPLFFLPEGQLDRKLYEAVNKVLTALGGKWDRGKKAHLFSVECEPLIEACIETGEVGTPPELGWFPTPDPLARRLVALAGVVAGMTALEPSAGEGAILGHLLAAGAKVHAVELDASRAKLLRTKYPHAIVADVDFLSLPTLLKFDRIVMNPPFAKRADIHHVNHAFDMLADGGRLVAIMSAGVKFREDRLTREFNAKCASIEELPAGSFKAAGTLVNTCIVILEKPL